jgi:hypothetical protein
MVIGPDTTFALTLTSAEMDTIYQAVIAMRFFDLPEPCPPFTPSGTYEPGFGVDHFFEIHAGGEIKRLRWKGGYLVPHPSDDWKSLHELQAMIWRMVERKPEYRALPRPRGGYL